MLPSSHEPMGGHQYPLAEVWPKGDSCINFRDSSGTVIKLYLEIVNVCSTFRQRGVGVWGVNHTIAVAVVAR
jgi:hypothetical protein